MKNFSDLLATEFYLDVCVNGICYTEDLLSTLSFNANDIVYIDNVEILPKYRYLAHDQNLSINEPFYRWYHRVSGQGWLLTPN